MKLSLPPFFFHMQRTISSAEPSFCGKSHWSQGIPYTCFPCVCLFISYPSVYSDTPMVIRLFTLLTPFMPLTSLVARSLSAMLLAMPVKVTTP